MLAALVSAACITPLTPVGHDRPAPATSHRASTDRTIAYIQENRDRYGISDAPNEFSFQSENVDQLGQRHVWLQQVYRGIPVWGQQLIVHFIERQEAKHISGTYKVVSAELNSDSARSPERVTAVVTQRKGVVGMRRVLPFTMLPQNPGV